MHDEAKCAEMAAYMRAKTQHAGDAWALASEYLA
jgi:hypothetical protein